MGWLDDDGDLIVVAVDEPIEWHGSAKGVSLAETGPFDAAGT